MSNVESTEAENVDGGGIEALLCYLGGELAKAHARFLDEILP